MQSRLAHRDFTSPSQPLLGAQPIRYELADRTRVVTMGGLGLIHGLVMKLKLPALLNGALGGPLKRHLPYWESDHLLALCYNVLTGGKPLQDLNRLRQDEVSLDALGVTRLPAPSTAGDFLRRFTSLRLILRLQEAIIGTTQIVAAPARRLSATGHRELDCADGHRRRVYGRHRLLCL